MANRGKVLAKSGLPNILVHTEEDLHFLRVKTAGVSYSSDFALLFVITVEKQSKHFQGQKRPTFVAFKCFSSNWILKKNKETN